jgi:hypothetical protein
MLRSTQDINAEEQFCYDIAINNFCFLEGGEVMNTFYEDFEEAT